MHRKKFFLFTVLVPATILAYTQPKMNIDSIDLLIKQNMEQHHIPGIAVCVVKEDKILFAKGYGWANLERKIPMTIEGVMNIASISKTITAAAVMQLWEKGKIDLDRDINAYLPFRVRNPHYPYDSITVRHLLTHTSSLNDGPAVINSYDCGDPKIPLKEWLSQYLANNGKHYSEKENFLESKPGEKYSYCNVGYGILGYIVETVAKIPFGQYCQQTIFQPLGMKNSGWFLSGKPSSKRVTNYLFINAENREPVMKLYARFFPGEKAFALNTNLATCLYGYPNYPDGLLRTSTRELSLFLSAFIGNGLYKDKKILKASTVQKMFNEGLCWDKANEGSLIGHGGYDPGVLTNMYFNPKTKIGVIVFQNNNEGNQFELVKKLHTFNLN